MGTLKREWWTLLGGGLAGLILLAGCAGQPVANSAADTPVVRPDETIMELVRADPEFSKLEAALIAAGLDGTLDQEDEPYTLFAPNDSAFDALPEGQLDRWMLDPLDIREVMLYHVLPATFSAADFAEGVLGVQTFQGTQISTNFQSDPPHVDRATVTRADVWAKNGVIHVIDRVLTPPGY